MTVVNHLNTIGLKRNMFTGLSMPYKKVESRQYFVDCECVCGAKRTIQYNVFVKGLRYGCLKCVNLAQCSMKPGERYGTWLTIEPVPRINKKTLWKCVCDCGTIGNIEVSKLKSGKSPNCMKCGQKDKRLKYDKYGKIYWNILKSIEQRGLKVEITKEDIDRLLVSQKGICALSGVPLYLSKNNAEQKLGFTTVSVDRIESNGDYTLDNIQLVHKDINRLKNSFNPHYFIAMCNNVAETHPMPIKESPYTPQCSKPSSLPCKHKVEFK